MFQIFDGVQGVATGILRGLGDTRSPMIWNLAGHWLFGLPVGYTLLRVGVRRGRPLDRPVDRLDIRGDRADQRMVAAHSCAAGDHLHGIIRSIH